MGTSSCSSSCCERVVDSLDGGFLVIAGDEGIDGEVIDGDRARAEKTFASEMR